MTLSTDERRALGIIAALLVLAGAARWLERPRPLLEAVPPMDVAALEQASRAAKGDPAAQSAGASPPKKKTTDGAQNATAHPRPPLAPHSTPMKIDPNTATAEQLARLPGVGPSLAGRIIEERERGPFRSIEDLTRVRGIGAALATGLADQMSLPAVSMRPEPVVNRPSARVKKAQEGPVNGVPGAPLDINDISSADLQKVPGVGPVLAGRLIARRDSLRRFTRWEQVDEVAGVGPAMLSRLKESLFIRP